MKALRAIALCAALPGAACNAAKEQICGAKEAVQTLPSSQPVIEVAEEPKDDHLSRKLRERRLALEEKQRTIEAKEKELEQRERRLAEATNETTAGLDPMIGILSTMQPKAAARMLDAMPESDAARVLRAMEVERASALLAGMDVARAARVGLAISKTPREKQ